jgi:hypothetical protein
MSFDNVYFQNTETPDCVELGMGATHLLDILEMPNCRQLYLALRKLGHTRVFISKQYTKTHVITRYELEAWQRVSFTQMIPVASGTILEIYDRVITTADGYPMKYEVSKVKNLQPKIKASQFTRKK